MDKAILSVVRYKKPERRIFEESYYYTDPFYSKYSEEERRKMWEKSNEARDRLERKYVASGGAKATVDLQKAQVFGFSKRAQKTLNDYRTYDGYEVIPVLLVPEEELESLYSKIQFLVNCMETEDGTVTFPDGDIWRQTLPGAES